MKKHSLGQWLFAVRPWSFPASAMPILVTLAYLFWAGAEMINLLKKQYPKMNDSAVQFCSTEQKTNSPIFHEKR